MEKTIKTTVHNRFDVEVRDAKTGDLKQEATGYNVVLDYFFKNLLVSVWFNRLGNICIGSGSGTPSIKDTGLFKSVGGKNATLVETVLEYPTSYVKKKIILNPGDFVGVSITEVGFGEYSDGSLTTKAMLKDSEGNNIAILKTAADIITIYATFFFTFNNHSDFCLFPQKASDNRLINCIINDNTLSGTSMYLTGHDYFSDETEAYNNKIAYIQSEEARGNLLELKAIYPKVRFDYNVANHPNGSFIKGIGGNGFAFWPLPNNQIFENLDLKTVQVGVGDGTTTKYASPIPEIVEGSEVIRIDGVVQEKGVHYLYKHNVNGIMWTQCFASTKKAALTGVDYSSEMIMPFRYPVLKKKLNPNKIMIEFDEVKKINVIKMCPNALEYVGSDICISYSNDAIHWIQAVTKTGAEAKAGFLHFMEPIEAKYWEFKGNNGYYKFSTSPNILIGYSEPEITFTTAPHENAVIEMDCTIDKPIKNENWVIDFGFSVQFQRG